MGVCGALCCHGITRVVSVTDHDQTTGQTSFSTDVKINVTIVILNVGFKCRSRK